MVFRQSAQNKQMNVDGKELVGSEDSLAGV